MLCPHVAGHIELPAAVYNPDYIKWVEENIREIDYVRKPGAMSLKWDALTDVDLQANPVVVMVTQTTVSRCVPSSSEPLQWLGVARHSAVLEFVLQRIAATILSELV